MRWKIVALLLAACGGSAPNRPGPVTQVADVDPDGPHRAAVTAQVQPYIDGALASSIVIGLYDAGKLEIYGFGKGPAGKPPTGRTLYELGSITKVYTGLLLADAVQRREVTLDTPVADLLPPGITVPIRDKVAITLRHLALHSSGLPRLPPSVQPASLDPYRGYTEDALYRDLLATSLEATPGTQVSYSNWGAGLLGFALGRRIRGGYAAALDARVLAPLELRDTHVGIPRERAAARAPTTNVDLAPAAPWTWPDTLAGAGALVSTARDQLRFLDAQLDAAAGGKLTLRPPMRLTQEPQLASVAENQGLGWIIDGQGRYFHNGGTTGSRAYIAFDPKTKQGVVVLASTGLTVLDRLGPVMLDVLDGKPPTPLALPADAQLASYAGAYDFPGAKLAVTHLEKRLYLEGPGEPPHRMVPIGTNVFWIEPLQSVAIFEKEGDAIARVVFVIGNQRIAAPRAP